MFNFTVYNNTSEANKVNKTLTTIASLSGEAHIVPIDIEHPVFDISVGAVKPNFNYVYWTQSGKYYFVEKSEWVGGAICRCYLSEDYLMTWKTGFLALDAYIKRTEDTTYRNKYLADNIPPFENDESVQYLSFNNSSGNWLGTNDRFYNSSRGHFIYFFNAASYKTLGGSIGAFKGPFIPVAMSYTDYYATENRIIGSVNSSLSVEETRSAINEVVSAAVYSPVLMPEGDSVKSIDLNTRNRFDNDELTIGLTTGSSAYAPSAPGQMLALVQFTCNVTNSGDYKKAAPFTQYQLEFLPFGVFDIDMTFANDATDVLTLYVYFDFLTGVGNLYYKFTNTPKIYLGSTNLYLNLYTYKKNGTSGYGIANQFASAVGVVGNAVNMAAQATSGNVLGVLGSAASIARSIDSLPVPTRGQQTLNLNGQFIGDPQLKVITKTQVTTPSAFVGYPSEQTVALEDITGFTIIGDIHLEGLSNITKSEMENLDRILKSGVIL